MPKFARRNVVDEDRIHASTTRAENGGRARTSEMRLAGRQRLEHRRRAVDRFDRDLEPFISEIAFTNRHEHRE